MPSPQVAYQPGVANHSANAVAVLLAIAVIMISLPAALYGFYWSLSELVSTVFARGLLRLQFLEQFFALGWFIVALAGRLFCVIVIVLDLILIFLPRASVRLKLLASAFAPFALLGTLVVESQVRHVRHSAQWPQPNSFPAASRQRPGPELRLAIQPHSFHTSHLKRTNARA